MVYNKCTNDWCTIKNYQACKETGKYNPLSREINPDVRLRRPAL